MRVQCTCIGCGSTFEAAFRASQRPRKFCGLPCYRLNKNGSPQDRLLRDRTCFHCGETKPPTDFYPDRKRGPFALSHRCKACEKTLAKRRYWANPEANNARKAAYHRANLDRLKAYAKRVYWSDPSGARLMSRAHHAVAQAIKRGKLTRPTTCEQCGQVGRIEAAHHDYTAPLDILWLCRSCHVVWDRAKPKRPHA